jgi:nucleoside-diphosphate-sugar epimerase
MVYGNFQNQPQREDAKLDPNNLYGLLKLHGEQVAKLTHENTVIVRPSAVYGPGDNRERVINKWTLAALANEKIVVNNPATLLDFTHVHDLVHGIQVAESKGQAGEAYNLTRGEARSLGEVALLIKSITNSRSEIGYNNNDVRDNRGTLDINKAYWDLGYTPIIDIIQGLERNINWMEKHHHVY